MASVVTQSQTADSFFEAVERNDFDTVRSFIENGADVNAKDINCVTPLFFAVRGSHLKMAELFLEKGADVNAKDKEGKTALDYAYTDEMKRLLEPDGSDDL